MDGPTVDGQSSGATTPSTEMGEWRRWHTASLFALTLVCVYIAIWRPFGLYVSWLVTMLVVVLFIAIAGKGIKGQWRGALIDERNKISLSRLQLVCWTALILPAIGVLGVARALEDPRTGLDLAIDPTIWLLLGISLTSLVGSPLIKDVQRAAPKPPEAEDRLTAQGFSTARVKPDGRLARNVSARDAAWSDLFMGEQVENAAYLDVSKVQMFFFTVLLLLAYGVAIGTEIRGEVVPSGLPEVGEGMLALLGLSHAGYLAGKAAPGATRQAAGSEGG